MIMSNIWVTTDWHAIEIDERTGRKSISNSFLKLTRKAEKLVQQNDIILCLGDIAFRGQDDIVNGKADEELSPFGDMIRNMPGYKILVKGNHDGLDNQEYLKVGFQEVGTAATLGDFLFTHKPYPVSNDQVNVHGHTHHEHYIGLDDGKHIAIPPTEKSNDPPLLLLDDVLEQAKQKRMKEPMRTVQHLKDADREFCHKLATDSNYLKEVISLEDSYEAVMTNGLNESIIIPQDNFILNYDKWDYGMPLWITGASGDGKSTLANKLAKDNNAIVVSTDYVLMYIGFTPEEFENKIQKLSNEYGLNLENNMLATEYINTHPNLPRGLRDPKTKTYNRNKTVPEMVTYFEWVYNKIRTDTKYHNQKYIIEGCEISHMDPDFFVDKPIIIMGGSRIQSFYRRIKRDNPQNPKALLKSLIKHVRKYPIQNAILDSDKEKFRNNLSKTALTIDESISPARIPGLGHHYIHPNAVQASMMLATMMDDGMDPTRDSDILETLNPDEVDISKTIDESISITPYDIMMGQVMNENIFLNDDDLYYNKDKFDSGEINLCFITGLSGSGKSTMGMHMRDKTIEHYELDDLLCVADHFSMANLKEYGDLIYSFFKGPGKKYYVTLEYLKKNNVSEFDYEYKLFPDFVHYAMKYAKLHKDKKFILEGIWLFCAEDRRWFNPKEFDDYAVYIKNTSVIVSMIRGAKRDASNFVPSERPREFIRTITKNFKRYFIDEKLLSEFRSYFIKKMKEQAKSIDEVTLSPMGLRKEDPKKKKKKLSKPDDPPKHTPGDDWDLVDKDHMVLPPDIQILEPRVSENASMISHLPNQISDESVTLYHGSPSKFKVAKVHDSGISGPLLFATDMRSFALAYAGNQWSDFEINQTVVNGIMYLTEILPNKFKEYFDRPGYLYVVDPSNFHSIDSVEFVSEKDAKVLRTYKINNVLKELEKSSDIKLYHYPNLPSFIPDREKYLRDMATKYDNHDIDKILNMVRELRVESEEITNPNDTLSNKAVKLSFYDKNVKIGEASISAIDTNNGFLYDFEVFKQYRGRGYGRRIMQYIMSHYSVTDLTVDSSNMVAINLYKSFGFKRKQSYYDKVNKEKLEWYQRLPNTINETIPDVSENASVSIVSLHGGLADDFHEVRSDYEPPERKALRLHKKALEYKLANLDEGAVDYLLREIRAYKIRFDRHGNVRITKRETNHLKEHFNNSVSLLRAYRNADDIASVKQECMKLRYMSEILLKYYIRPNNHSDEMKELINLRSTILNALNTNLKWVKQRDPKYNFAEEYDKSKYGSDINLPRNVVRDATKTIVTLLV